MMDRINSMSRSVANVLVFVDAGGSIFHNVLVICILFVRITVLMILVSLHILWVCWCEP